MTSSTICVNHTLNVLECHISASGQLRSLMMQGDQRCEPVPPENFLKLKKKNLKKKGFKTSKMSFLNNCHLESFEKIAIFGNFQEKNGNFLAIS